MQGLGRVWAAGVQCLGVVAVKEPTISYQNVVA